MFEGGYCDFGLLLFVCFTYICCFAIVRLCLVVWLFEFVCVICCGFDCALFYDFRLYGFALVTA